MIGGTRDAKEDEASPYRALGWGYKGMFGCSPCLEGWELLPGMCIWPQAFEIKHPRMMPSTCSFPTLPSKALNVYNSFEATEWL
jgi:hypothetical protein